MAEAEGAVEQNPENAPDIANRKFNVERAKRALELAQLKLRTLDKFTRPRAIRQGANVGRSIMDLVQEANEKFHLPAFARGAIGPRARVAVEVGKLEDYLVQ